MIPTTRATQCEAEYAIPTTNIVLRCEFQIGHSGSHSNTALAFDRLWWRDVADPCVGPPEVERQRDRT